MLSLNNKHNSLDIVPGLVRSCRHHQPCVSFPTREMQPSIPYSLLQQAKQKNHKRKRKRKRKGKIRKKLDFVLKDKIEEKNIHTNQTPKSKEGHQKARKHHKRCPLAGHQKSLNSFADMAVPKRYRPEAASLMTVNRLPMPPPMPAALMLSRNRLRPLRLSGPSRPSRPSRTSRASRLSRLSRPSRESL